MKKLLLTTLLTITPAYAFDDVLIISPTPVNSVIVKDNSILDAKPLFTIDNEKKFIIIKPIKEGKTVIELTTANGSEKLDVNINKTTNIDLPKGYNMFEIDMPPSNIEIPLPPEAIEIIPPPTIYKEEKGGK